MEQSNFHEAKILITSPNEKYTLGDTITGQAEVQIPAEVSLSNISLSYQCMGEVKWVEYPSTPYYLDGYIYNEDVNFFEEVLPFTEKDVSVAEESGQKRITIPFKFVIPMDKNLPSTMISKSGFIRHFIGVAIKSGDEIKKFIKDVIVQAPMDKDLNITVGATVEKVVLFHSGTVSMHATIGRKGFTPGETITIHIAVDNKTNAKVIPRASLHQVQIYMSGVRHKTIETALSDEAILGQEIEPHTTKEVLLDVVVPKDESLSIKSSLITVKYFVHVTLDIPHSLDLHVNLPVVVTSKAVIEKLQKPKHEQAELINL